MLKKKRLAPPYPNFVAVPPRYLALSLFLVFLNMEGTAPHAIRLLRILCMLPLLLPAAFSLAALPSHPAPQPGAPFKRAYRSLALSGLDPDYIGDDASGLAGMLPTS